MNNELIVAERFHSLQCEGRAIGTPAVFLRLGGCNLLCQSKTWVCDTIDVWKHGKRMDFASVLPVDYINKLNRGDHLIITGGEPLLQQLALVEYFRWILINYHFTPFIEVETNGTIIPNDTFSSWVSWWNCSPKLSNSGEPYNKRINKEALLSLREKDTIFKFVVQNNDDVLEIEQDYGFRFIKEEQIILMPAGATRDELDAVRLKVVEICIERGYRYSDRLHIVIWNKKTGV